jgi:hypothetical protein
MPSASIVPAGITPETKPGFFSGLTAKVSPLPATGTPAPAAAAPAPAAAAAAPKPSMLNSIKRGTATVSPTSAFLPSTAASPPALVTTTKVSQVSPNAFVPAKASKNSVSKPSWGMRLTRKTASIRPAPGTTKKNNKNKGVKTNIKVKTLTEDEEYAEVQKELQKRLKATYNSYKVTKTTVNTKKLRTNLTKAGSNLIESLPKPSTRKKGRFWHLLVKPSTV